MSRKGFPWTQEEEERLKREYLDAMVSLETIADSHGRTVDAIQGRLQKMELQRKEWYLFVLLLVKDRYFVGLTRNPQDLLKYYVMERKEGENPWLDAYPVVGKVELYEIRELFEVDQKVKHYMYRFGLDRVRGGSYSSLTLSDAQFTGIKAELSFVYQCDQGQL